MNEIGPSHNTDTLPLSIPKLEVSGLNWAIFSLHFQDAIEAKGYWGHFDGTAPQPVAPTTVAPVVTATTGALAPTAPVAPTPDKLAAIAQCNKDEWLAKSLLIQKIPDSALMKIRNKKSVKECWNTIVKEYIEKGTLAQTELCVSFLKMKCPDKGDVH